MTKSDSASYVAERMGLNKEEARKVLECYIEYIKKTVASGNQVQLRGFGRFFPQKRAAKVGRNINKNIALNIPESIVPKFKPSKNFILKVQSNDQSDF